MQLDTAQENAANFADGNEKISECIDYLSNLKEPSIIVNDVQAYAKVAYLNMICQVRSYFDLIDWNMFADKRSYELFAEIIYYLYEIKDELEFANVQATHKSILLVHLVKLVNSIVSKSLNFGAKFNSSRGLDAFFLVLKDDELVTRIRVEHSDTINTICANLNWLSRVSEDTLKKWRSLDAVPILLDMLRKDSTKASISVSQTVINIASDEELDNMPEIELPIRQHMTLLETCAQDFEQDHFNREFKEFMADDNTIAKYKVHLINTCAVLKLAQAQYLTLTSILLVFYRLSINETIKLDLYFNHKIVALLKVILAKASLIEQKYVLKLVAQLTFNKKITEDLLLDTAFVDLIKCGPKTDGFLKEIARQINWNLGLNSPVCRNTGEKQATTQGGDEHIMISYNTASRELCLKIKSQLESRGFKIWIDVNDIHGSSLDAMANAVEKSLCVLMCVSEKYRQSVNCQAEAQYAFRLNKKIIPLIMQSGYENVQGWLGIIMGDKIFVNFTKYDYDECIRRLLKELSVLNVHDKTQSPTPSTIAAINKIG